MTAGPGKLSSGPVAGIGKGGVLSLKFSLAGTETFSVPKIIATTEGRDGMPYDTPKLVRLRSQDFPYWVFVTESFPLTSVSSRLEVPGGSEDRMGMLELVAYGAVKVGAYAMNSRAVADAHLEVIPYSGHLPIRPPFSDRATVVTASADDVGAWNSIGWQPAGRPRLDIVTLGGLPIEFGFFPSNVSPDVVASFIVAGALPGGIVHPSAYLLYARHPGGDVDTRTAICTWSRGVG